MPAALPIAASSAETRFGVAPQIRSPQEAAQAFEGMLLKQLFGEMSKTVGSSGLFGSGFEADMYGDMFVDALTSEASKGGIGIAQLFEQALGVEERPEALSPIAAMASRVRAMSAYGAPSPIASTTIPVSSDLANLVNQWLDGPAAVRWGKEGALTPDDLGADIATPGKEGAAVFNVLDANGYKGHPKCNLFALEFLRRAGFAVPVQAREHGWGYPGAEAVTRAASSGQARPWSVLRTGASTEALQGMTEAGTPLLLTGSGNGEVMGHMGIVDRIHSIKRNTAGDIVSVDYSGWEAGGSKAGYARRTWRVAGEPGPGRGGLTRIEILEARPAASAQAYHPMDSAQPGQSLHDLTRREVMAQGTDRFPDVERREIVESDLAARRNTP